MWGESGTVQAARTKIHYVYVQVGSDHFESGLHYIRSRTNFY
ncbi:hypothetical protein Tsp_12189, partial [Trichinella spiralis]